VKDMGHYVNSRIFPTDKFSVVPYNVANSWSRHVFRLATFWEHMLAPSTNKIQKLDRGLPESANFSTYSMQKFGNIFLPSYSWFSGHGTIQ
jgi:hypothetical protein